MLSFLAFVAVAAGLCGGVYLATKRPLLALASGVVAPSIGDLLLLQWLYGGDAFDLITLAINLTVSLVVSFLTLLILSFNEEDG